VVEEDPETTGVAKEEEEPDDPDTTAAPVRV
jgi:hypothetical protein